MPTTTTAYRIIDRDPCQVPPRGIYYARTPEGAERIRARAASNLNRSVSVEPIEALEITGKGPYAGQHVYREITAQELPRGGRWDLASRSPSHALHFWTDERGQAGPGDTYRRRRDGAVTTYWRLVTDDMQERFA